MSFTQTIAAAGSACRKAGDGNVRNITHTARAWQHIAICRIRHVLRADEGPADYHHEVTWRCDEFASHDLSDPKRDRAVGGTSMRWLHLAVVVIFAVAALILVVQNFEIVTISFLGFSARAPLALLVAIVYVLGMATGGSLWSLLRRSLHGSKLVEKP
jgi:uncharacterized integral membrane protein